MMRSQRPISCESARIIETGEFEWVGASKTCIVCADRFSDETPLRMTNGRAFSGGPAFRLNRLRSPAAAARTAEDSCSWPIVFSVAREAEQDADDR